MKIFSHRRLLIALIIADLILIIVIGAIMVTKSNMIDANQRQLEEQINTSPAKYKQAGFEHEEMAEKAYHAGDITAAKKHYANAKKSYEAADDHLKVQSIDAQLHLLELQPSPSVDNSTVEIDAKSSDNDRSKTSPTIETPPPNTLH